MLKTFYRMAACALCGTLFWHCATFNPQPLDERPLRERAVSQAEKQVRVTATVLGAEETQATFGLQLYKKGIQPVWLEIENNTEHRMWFPPVSVDRSYFSALEVAYIHHSGYSRSSRQRMDRFFDRYAMRNFIAPGTARSGFVFTNLKMGTKAFNVEVVGEDHHVRTFTFLIPVTGFPVDHREVDWTRLYASHEILHLDSSQALREALENLPCCTTGADGKRLADPINVVIIGRGMDILYALLRSDWAETASASSYDPLARQPWAFRHQPVKALYLFKRPQDAAFRKSRSTLNERNQLRLWLSPFFLNGTPVWVGQISRIVRRAIWDQFIIEPDVDEARTYLLQDLWYAQGLEKYGYIRKSPVAPLSAPRQSLHDDNYFTDGLCLVLWVSGEPVSFADVQFEPWERPVMDRRRLLLNR